LKKGAEHQKEEIEAAEAEAIHLQEVKTAQIVALFIVDVAPVAAAEEALEEEEATTATKIITTTECLLSAA